MTKPSPDVDDVREDAAPIYDLTSDLQQAQWAAILKGTSRLELGCAAALSRGLYAQYLFNDHDDTVHDRNREMSLRPRDRKPGRERRAGKLLLNPRLGALKIGKFEGGFGPRRIEDAKHFHRHAAGAFSVTRPCALTPTVYSECLRLALVLDLTRLDIATVRREERALRRGLDNFVASRGLAVTDRRGDYRVLSAADDTAECLREYVTWAREAMEHIWHRCNRA